MSDQTWSVEEPIWRILHLADGHCPQDELFSSLASIPVSSIVAAIDGMRARGAVVMYEDRQGRRILQTGVRRALDLQRAWQVLRDIERTRKEDQEALSDPFPQTTSETSGAKSVVMDDRAGAAGDREYAPGSCEHLTPQVDE